MVSHTIPAAIIVVLLVSCGSGDEAPVRTEGSGPPQVRTDVVADHDEQLDVELGPRPGGSQQEQIASQYVLGHLQRAGYLVRLDAVPVGNLVESSNLLALPPSENDPVVVVVAPYDSPEGKATGGERTGFLLELARAFNVVAPGHDVEFAALGAEFSEGRDDRLGSRRLVQLMLDEGLDPLVVQLGRVADGAAVAATGDLAPDVVPGSEATRDEEDVFETAGFEQATVSGDPARLGEILLDFLKQEGG